MGTNLSPEEVVNMPKMDGIEATKHIKTAQPTIIVIGLSVNDSTQVRKAMERAGAEAFLSKDAAAEQLYTTMATLIHQRGTLAST